jgi:hypothetical protein
MDEGKRMTPSPATLLDARAITALHDASTKDWHRQPIHNTNSEDFSGTLRAQHLANFELWHLEDEARAPQATDHQIAEIKRSIDRTNQLRNNLMERLDKLLLEALDPQGLPAPQAQLHSETPGLILDRLSILALKIFHTGEETQRIDVSKDHILRNKDRLSLLEEQRSDLTACLDRLWAQVLSGECRFKLYRQLKMYNDPALNPAIYTRAAKKTQP